MPPEMAQPVPPLYDEGELPGKWYKITHSGYPIEKESKEDGKPWLGF
jgi:hypothetical protein